MKRRYFELIADLVSGDKTAEQVEACMERFSADEEPAYHARVDAQQPVHDEYTDRLAPLQRDHESKDREEQDDAAANAPSA
jgi:hypothetical protein